MRSSKLSVIAPTNIPCDRLAILLAGIKLSSCVVIDVDLFVYFLSAIHIQKTAQISQFERFVYVLSLCVLCDQWSWREMNPTL